jgi:hypothetical protein
MQREWQGYQDKQDVRNYSYPDHPVIPANCLFYSPGMHIFYATNLIFENLLSLCLRG